MFELRHVMSILGMWMGMDLSPAVTHIPNLENLNLKQEISYLDKEFDHALIKQCDVLSPIAFVKAKKTRDGLLVPIIGQNKKQILYQINLAKAYLAMAVKNSDSFTTQMPELVKSRDDALAVRAEQHFSKAFLETDLILKKLAIKIEEGKKKIIFNNNTNRTLHSVVNLDESFVAQNLTALYRDFELNAIRIETLGPIWKILVQINSQKWKNSLPVVIELVLNHIDEVDHAIRNNRYDTFEIEKRASLARKMALNLKQLAMNGKNCHDPFIKSERSHLEKDYWKIRCQFLPEEVDVEMVKEENRIIIYLKSSPVIRVENGILLSDDILITKLKKILKILSVERIDFYEYREEAKTLRKIQYISNRIQRLFENYLLTDTHELKNKKLSFSSNAEKKVTIGIVLYSKTI